MPSKNWRTVNVRAVVYAKLEKIAKKEGRNVSNVVDLILDKVLDE